MFDVVVVSSSSVKDRSDPLSQERIGLPLTYVRFNLVRTLRIFLSFFQ